MCWSNSARSCDELAGVRRTDYDLLQAGRLLWTHAKEIVASLPSAGER